MHRGICVCVRRGWEMVRRVVPCRGGEGRRKSEDHAEATLLVVRSYASGTGADDDSRNGQQGFPQIRDGQGGGGGRGVVLCRAEVGGSVVHWASEVGPARKVRAEGPTG